MTRRHHLTVAVDGVELDGWKTAAIESDILTPGDAFTLTRGYDALAYKRLRLDAEVTLLVDGTPILNGFIETRRGNWQGFTIAGKDRVARMVAESAPLDLDLAGRDLVSVAGELAAPWFERIVLSNAENRELMRGGGRKGHGRPLLNPSTDARRVAPGASKWEALDELLQRAGYLAWSSGDGQSLIIARPGFGQEVLHVFHVAEGSCNCADISYNESNASRYALIVAIGTGRGDDLNHAAHSLARWAASRDNPEALDGTGENFLHAKRLVLPVEATSVEDCQRQADQERAEREAQAFQVDILAWSWGQ